MPKVKAVTAMKQRLQVVLFTLAEQDDVIDLMERAIENYGLEPADCSQTRRSTQPYSPNLLT